MRSIIKYTIFIITLSSVFESYLFAQNPISNPQFLPIEANLSQNTAITVLQDKMGFLWIGTRSGLNKYDGINMVSYYHDESDSTSLSNNYVRVLYQSSSGDLWIGTDGGGLCKYDELTDSFIRYESTGDANTISGNSIYAIYEDHNSNLWVGTQNNGLNIIDKKSNSIVHYRKNSNDPFSISANHVTGIAQDQFLNIWISTWGGGINLFDENTRRFIHYKSDPKNPKSIVSNIIRTMYTNSEGEIFLGTDSGLDKLKFKAQGQYVFEHIALEKSTTAPVVLSILEDRKNQLWVGTENIGIYLLENGQSKIGHFEYDPKYEYSIQNNSIWSLYEDTSGIIWVGTFNKGLFKLDEHLRKFRSYKHSTYYDNSLSNNSVSSFVEDKNNNVWVGTDGGGLDYWDLSDNSFSHYNQTTGISIKNEVLALMIDSHENLWAGTWYGGLMIKKNNAEIFRPFIMDHPMIDEPGKENIFSIIEDRKGRIWIALYRDGLMMYDPSTRSFTGFENDEWNEESISSNLVRCLMEDGNGNIWIGTEGGGINKLLENKGNFTFERFLSSTRDSNTICSNSVLSIQEDKAGNLWVGTTAGLNHFEVSSKTWTKYGKKDGLPDEVIYAIQIDNDSNLWLSSNRGLSKLNIETKDVRNYDENDGLQSMEFFKNASLKLESGELLFGGVEGLNIFHPSQIIENIEEPKVYLSAFKISNQKVTGGIGFEIVEPLHSAKQINLKHDQNDFSFEFAELNFSQSPRNEYAYQLVNYDKEWQEVGTRREAYYTNVPPGRYIFKVKGTTNDGRWSPKEASIVVIIASPWYDNNIAYFGYFVLFVVLIAVSIRTFVIRERLKNQLRLDQMDITKMQELDAMKSSFFTNISHEFRSPLTLILGPLNVLKENASNNISNEQIDMMIRNAESLLNLINQLLELSKLESRKMRMEIAHEDIVSFLKPIVHSFSSLANQKFITYKASFPEHKVMIYFDKEKLEKIMVNLVSNALKFTPDFGKIHIQLEEGEGEIKLSVKDNGIGIPNDEIDFVFNRYYRAGGTSNEGSKGTGIGLSLTQELVEIHEGKIEVESKVNKGSVFTVTLKKGKAHFNTEDIVDNSKPEYLFEKQIESKSDTKSEYQKDGLIKKELVKRSENKPMVLLVEDNSDIRKHISEILGEEYLVLEVDNGTEGLELAMEKIPDIIISDVMLSGLNGFELCKKVKEDIKTSHIPVVLLTAKASNDSAVEGFEVGADYYITKPFNPKLLSLRIRNALQTKKQITDQVHNKGTLQLEPSQVKIAQRDEGFINRAIEIVEDNMSNSEFYVDDLGKELGLSRMQLYRKLKAMINQSANEFVRSIRLKRAAQLIAQDQLTISEITYLVGFNDLQYFRDCFKKQFGVNPSEYARQSQKA